MYKNAHMDHITYANRRRTLLVAAPLLAGALLMGACSKSSDQNTTSNGNAGTTATTAAKTSQTSGGSTDTASKGTTKGTSAAQSSLNGLKVWWHGFRYDLGDISFDSTKQQAQILTKVTNLGNDTAQPDPDNALIKGGAQIATGTLETKPSITGGKTVDDTLIFSIEEFSPSGTTLLFTDGSSYQEVKVPLDGKGEATTLEPVEQKQTVPPIVIGAVTFTPKKVEVRYDLPNDHSFEAEAGTAVLIISGSSKNDSSNQLQYDQSGVTVTTSTGTYPAKFIGGGDVIPPNQTNDKTSFYFSIKQPVDGDWTLEMKDQPFGESGATVSGTAYKGTLSSKVASSTTGTTR